MAMKLYRSQKRFHKLIPCLSLLTISFFSLIETTRASTDPSLPKAQSPQETQSPISLPPLPYDEAALEPYITKKTLEFHYGKHHKGYVEKLNSLIAEEGNKKIFKGKSLEEIMLLSGKEKVKNANMTAVFNNSAQTWNHTFYWKSMKKDGGGEPTGALLEQIKKDFGSYAEFKKQFVEAGLKQFGSGWVWLVQSPAKGGGTLKILATGNADNPMLEGHIPLMTCDIWEHAYYLDYQNRRKEYVEVFLDHLVNWEFAQVNFDVKK